METKTKGNDAFAYLEVELAPGETIIAESNAMASMSAAIDLQAKFNGGFFKGLLRKYLGGESLFVSHFSNPSNAPQKIVLAQSTPGSVRMVELDGNTFCMQPGAFVACTRNIRIGLRWAGLASFIAKEGLFKIEVSGEGKVWYGAYGTLLERDIDGEILVDTGHLVAYEPQMKLKLQLAGGLFSSFFGGEGLVTRVSGKGKIIIQTRSLTGLAGWINPKF